MREINERYMFGVDELFIKYYVYTCFDFKFAHIQKKIQSKTISRIKI